jgi:hypothetical protein
LFSVEPQKIQGLRTAPSLIRIVTLWS